MKSLIVLSSISCMHYINKASSAWVAPPNNKFIPQRQTIAPHSLKRAEFNRVKSVKRELVKNYETNRKGSEMNSKSSNNMLRSLVTVGVASCILSMSFLTGSPAVAADYGSLTPEQKTVAEAWRTVDNTFLDRSFNGLDWFQIRQDAVHKKYKTTTDAQNEIESFMSKLGDKYTRYLSPAKYESIVNAATGTLVGVGVEISQDGTKIIASDVEENSPAKSAGIQPNDVFVEVDGVRFSDTSTPDELANVLRGPKGSKVGVVMQRGSKTLDFIITRQPITVTSVKTTLVQKPKIGPVGVIRIKSFSGTTAATVSNAFQKLKADGAKSFVLDLRRNPGGLLPGGVDTASLFLDNNKPVVFVVDKRGTIDSQTTITTGIDITSPLVLLVDKSTASAAEVLTAALKENNRVKVVGEQTFGKGIVQTIRQLSDNNGGVAVTIARYETPEHHDINKEGIEVDFKLGEDCMSQTYQEVVSCLPNEAFQSPVP